MSLQISPLRMFNMNQIPSDRDDQTDLFGTVLEETVVVASVPVPPREHPLADPFTKRGRFLGAQIWDHIDRQPELVSRHKLPGFRGTFGEEIILPLGMAECLKDFEVGLRSAGLMGVDEELVQSTASPGKFRVQKRRVCENRHSGFSSAFSGHGYDMRSPALTNCAVGRPRVKGAPVAGEPSLPLKLTRPKRVRKKGA